MKIFIDAGHPAHIHFFYPIIKKLIQDGHECLLCIREKDCSVQIAESYNLKYTSKGKGSYSLLFKPFYLVRAIRKIYATAKKFNPDVFLSFASPYAGIVASFLNKLHVTFDDTESDPILQWIYRKFSSQIITPTCFQKYFGKKHIRVNSYKELAYLSPLYFLKDPGFKKQLGFQHNQDYILIRLVNHGNMHDVFGKKWAYENKMKFVEKLARSYPIVISTEIALPKNLEKFRFNLSEEKFLQALAHAKLVVGESATVATESAILGVPAIYIDYNTRGYIDEIEKDYQLIHHIIPTKKNLDKTKSLINGIMQNSSNSNYLKSQQKLLSDKINVTNFMVWFIQNYPKSAKIMKENPDYQYKFK